MNDSASVTCPFCGEETEFDLEPSLPRQQVTVDCEVCCRPFVVAVECENGEVLSVEARSG